MYFLRKISLMVFASCFLFAVGCSTKKDSGSTEAATEEMVEETTETIEEAVEAIDSVATEVIDSLAN